MGQPTIAIISTRAVATFGGVALPNGQGTMASLNLNDGTNTLLNDFNSDENNRQIRLAQLLYRGRGVYVSDDFGPRKISLPMTYIEDGSHFLGQFLAVMAMAGEQQLSFDAVTYILAKFAGISNRTAIRRGSAWQFNLDLICKSPWFQDAAATTVAPVTITVDAGQTINITYPGSVWAEPTFTYHVPATNAVVINSIQVKNTMSGEFLTVNFLATTPLPASTLADISINCALMTATNTTNGNVYDVIGSFPMLYGPVGTVNPIQIISTPASGSTSGCTLAASYNPRWMI